MLPDVTCSSPQRGCAFWEQAEVMHSHLCFWEDRAPELHWRLENPTAIFKFLYIECSQRLADGVVFESQLPSQGVRALVFGKPVRPHSKTGRIMGC